MIKIIEKELADWLTNSLVVDPSRLPDFTRKCVEMLSWLAPRTPKEVFLLIINTKLSEAFNYYRIKVKSQSFECPANVYWLNFTRSGWWKNRWTDAFENHVMTEYIQRYNSDKTLINEQLIEAAKIEAEKLYTHKWSISKHINENSPREISRVIQKWNMPALMAVRQQFQKINIGWTFIYIDEFSDYIKTMENDKASFISMCFSIYDKWNFAGEILRGQKKTGETYWIPNTILFHTDPDWLLSWDWRDKLMSFLNQWLARRSLFCFTDKLWSVKKEAVKDKKDIRDIFDKRAVSEYENILWASWLRDEFSEMFNAIRWEFKMSEDMTSYDNSTYVLDKDAYFYYQMYEAYCIDRSEKFWKKDWFSWYLAELEWRAWKMVKLSWIVACQNHPNVKKVYKSDILQAIYQVELFWLHFQKFYEYKDKWNVDLLFNFFKENLGKNMTKTYIRENTTIVSKNFFGRMFKECLPDMEEYCEEKGYSFNEVSLAKNAFSYSMTSREVEVKDDIFTTCSQWSSNDKTCTAMTPYKIAFSWIPKLLEMNRIYSFTQFKDNYRKQANALPTINTIALDIDDNLSLEKAIELLENYKWWICTSRNHQKDKHWLICDRFRVVLPVVETEITNEFLKNVMPSVEMHLFKQKDVLDSSCFETSRMFFWNPEQQVFELTGNKILDLKKFYKKPEPKKEYVAPVQKSYDWPKANVLEGFNWAEYNLAPWETKPCQCPNPAHEDKNNSAFVWVSEKSWNKFVKCSGCWMDPVWEK